MCDHSYVYSIRDVVVIQSLLCLMLAASSDAASFPHCVFLDRNQELDCSCQSSQGPPDLQPITFPNPEALRLGTSSTFAASIKIHSCEKLRLRLDLTPLTTDFYRFRVEDISESASIEDILVRPNDLVDINIERAGEQLHLLMTGNVTCPLCADTKSNASVRIRIDNAKSVNFESWFMHGVDVRMKIQTAKNLSISDSYFSNLSASALEISDVEEVLVFHTEFHQNPLDGPPVLVFDNRVRQVTIKDSLMNKNWVQVSSPLTTNLSWLCTSSPAAGEDEEDEDLALCSDIGRYYRKIACTAGCSSVESTGAIVIAIVSASLLAAAVATLVLLHKRGKLERYL